MRRLVALVVVLAVLVAPAAEARISLMGLTNSLVQFALARISVPGSLEITAETVEESEDGLTELVGVRVADSQGVWLEIDGLGVSWNARRILLGELEIRRLAARGVRVLRRPEPSAVAIETLGEPAPPAQFRWPRAPITTRIETLSLTAVEISAGVLADQSLAFDATGNARDEGNEQAAQLSLERTDSVQGRIALDYLRDFAADTLRLNLDAGEAAGGLVAALLGLPEGSASRVQIAADGPLSDWAVTLEAEAEGVLQAVGSAAIDLGPPFAFDADFRVVPGPLMEPQVATLLSPEARLTARAREGADGIIDIEEARIVAADLGLEIDGTFARETGAFEGSVVLEARQGLSLLVEGVDFRRAGFDGRVEGTLEALTATGALALEGLETATVDIGSARLDATVTRDGPRIGADLAGSVGGLRLDRIGPDLLGETVLTLRATVDGPALSLDTLRLAGPLLTLEASGQADTEADTASLTYALGTPDLRPIAEAYDVDAGGQVAVSGQLDGSLSAPRLVGEAALQQIVFDGTAYGRAALEHDVTLGTWPQGTVRLVSSGSPVGPAQIAADFVLDGDRLALSSLSAAMLGVTADGAVTVDLATRLAEGAVDARIADLAPLAAFLDQDVAGQAEGRIGLAVRDGLQDVVLALTGADLAAADARLGRFALDATLRDALGAPSVEGRLSADDVAAAGYALASLSLDGRADALLTAPTGSAQFSVTGVSGPDLALAAASGTARLDALGPPLVLELDMAAQGLAAAGVTVPDLTAMLNLTARGAASDAVVVLEAPRTDLDGGRLGPLRIEGTVQDALTEARVVDAVATLGGARFGDIALSRARVTLAGPMEALALAADAAGTAAGDKPLALRLRGTIDARDTAAVTATLAEAAATYDTLDARLNRPVRLALGPALAVQGLDLSLPGGRLRADVAGEAAGGLLGTATLELADAVPLASFAGLPLDRGGLSADARLDTRGGRASARSTVTGRGLSFTGIDVGRSGFDLDATLGWNGSRATVDATLVGPFGQPVVASVAVPVSRGADGLPVVSPGGRLGGTLRWQGRIGDLWTLVPTADHVLDGFVDADLELSGTVASPQIGGRLGLREGRYENLLLGTILTDLTVTSTIGADGSFGLEARAADASDGVVTASARLRGGTLAARVDSDGAVLVRRDDATAEVSLAITADGPLAAPRIAGRIGIDRAEVRLVNATPPSVADLGPIRIRGEPALAPVERGGESIALDLRIEAPGNVFVRGRGLDSEWRIAMAVRGTAATPEITGNIERIRGVLNLIGYPFDLATGEIRFPGGQPIDPVLDIALTRENDGVTGGIFVGGRASDIDINFRSTPSLPEDEVLPRVLFGQSRQSLTGAQGLQLALGLATLLDGSGGALDAVRATVGLDVLRVEDDGANGAQVTVGSNVADGVFVGARQPLDGGPAKVIVEIEVYRDVIVDTEIGPEQGSSVGLSWRRRF